ncbi:MAG: NAD(P)-dependent oxidoreductase [Akkermansiaceae bacterium]|nr:NAD(P)-dependent oxidoreductase [Akkermansiaceae bacterium]
MDIVLTGSTGKLGGHFWRAWNGIHDVSTLRRDMVDFRNPEAVRRRLSEMEFDVLVNCAAMATPESCEMYPSDAHRVNAETPGVMAAICHEKGARMIHFSTDYVLDGSISGLKDEHAATNPVNHYGISKLDGERLVLDRCPTALVCRTSWVFGTAPPGFVESFLDRARRGEPLDAVNDKWSMPTAMHDVERWIAALLDRRDVSGILHLTNAGEPETWWTYGSKVLEIATELGAFPEVPRVKPATLAGTPQLSAPRPVHTAMEPHRLMVELGFPVRRWEEAARERIQELLGPGECH